MGCIRLKNLILFPRLGITTWEKEGVQKIAVDLELHADLTEAARSDRIEMAVNYEEVCRVVQEVSSSRKFHLIESLAHEILAALMERFPSVRQGVIRLRKVSLPFDAHLECVEVELEAGGAAAADTAAPSGATADPAGTGGGA